MKRRGFLGAVATLIAAPVVGAGKPEMHPADVPRVGVPLVSTLMSNWPACARCGGIARWGIGNTDEAGNVAVGAYCEDCLEVMKPYYQSIANPRRLGMITGIP